jgi:hypothetical protein
MLTGGGGDINRNWSQLKHRTTAASSGKYAFSGSITGESVVVVELLLLCSSTVVVFVVVVADEIVRRRFSRRWQCQERRHKGVDGIKRCVERKRFSIFQKSTGRFGILLVERSKDLVLCIVP